ncbi:heat shock 70 kDa 12A-like protein [Labeo rohita]|uniref:Heat shock 70 kDa 12A-like protein n=1 Tax=Labeo rohita TaxID=84645 RepID=A0A498MP27_LABRO|nr:heat shock 70 kDa 12A-like protein [Labeo rohita]
MRELVMPKHALAIQQLAASFKFGAKFYGISGDAEPHGPSVSSASVGPSAKGGPASYAAPSVLAETTGSISCMASRTLAYQGGPGLCKTPDPLEGLTMDGERCALGMVCRRKTVTTDASNMGWGALCNGTFWMGSA